MYRVLRPFEYLKPNTVEEAVKALSAIKGETKVLAGGVDLIPKMRRREESPVRVVNIQGLPGLDHVETENTGALRIGALVSLRAVEQTLVVAKNYCCLYEAAHQIASVQVKTMGTLVGNLCVATPASDVATALLVLGAKLTIAGNDGGREVTIEEFFRGPGETVLATHELVTNVVIPDVSAGTGSAFMNLTKTKADIAKVSVAVALTITEGVCQEIRIALGAVAPTPIRCANAEAVLIGQNIQGNLVVEAAEMAAEACSPITDIRSDADYRKDMVRVLSRRAIERARERANVYH